MEDDEIRLYVGYDPREAVVFHTFVQSVIETCSMRVSIHPLAQRWNEIDGRRDGSNDFVYSRFLVPWLSRFQGRAIYADGDMVVKGDLAEVWRQAYGPAAWVVKHEYVSKAPYKYLSYANESYPRKNWSSLILWECGHFANRHLSPDCIARSEGAYLHRFAWLKDEQLGELPKEWNWLTTEYPRNPEAKLLHYTLGAPCFEEYKNCDHAADWGVVHERSQYPLGVGKEDLEVKYA